jgi:hypothetical protein
LIQKNASNVFVKAPSVPASGQSQQNKPNNSSIDYHLREIVTNDQKQLLDQEKQGNL